MEIKKLILKNFRSHRALTLDFASGVTGICGGNGSGKSSVVEAMVFLLTGEGYAKSKSDMITVGQTTGYVIGHLLIDGKEAILERHTDTAKVNFVYDGVTYKKSSEVNEIWDKLFQIDKHILQNVVVSNQGEIALLFNGDASTKEKLFQKIFMVPNTTKLRDTIWNNYIKTAPPEYPIKDATLISSEIQCVEKLIEMVTEELSTQQVDEDEYNKLIARKAYLDKVEESQSAHKQLSEDLETSNAAVVSVSNEIATLQTKMASVVIADYRDCVAAQKAAKPLFENRLKWLNRKSSLTVPDCKIVGTVELEEAKQKVADLDAELKSKRASVVALNRKLEEYEKSGLGSGTCPTCGTKVDNVLKLIEHVNKELDPLINEGLALKAKFIEATEERDKLQKTYNLWEAYKKEEKEIASALEASKDVVFNQDDLDLCQSVLDKYSAWEIDLASLHRGHTSAQSRVNEQTLKLSSLTSYDRSLDSFEDEKRVVSEALTVAKASKEKAKALEIEIATNKVSLATAKKELKENSEYIEKNKKRKEYIGVLNSLYELFHTSKFPRSLIQTYASTVSEYMNSVLASFDFPYTAKVNESFGIDVFNDEGLQMPAISGGQQVMVGFSLRLALHNMFVGAFPFMIVDEGSYGLNNENAKKYFEIIRSLGKDSKFKQVIVIDHHNELSEYVDNTINL
jgi:DNA repair exonuclease SbcCD ATPase subunit